MISSSNYKRVEIDIITYKKIRFEKVMNEDKAGRGHLKNNHNRFICSICLNKKPSKKDNSNVECCKRKSKSCPICDGRNFQTSDDNENNQNIHIHHKNIHDNEEKNGKNIQTSQPDVTQGLSLLNEVLTVFQNKKQTANPNRNNKTIILKDACVETDIKKCNPKLSISKVFHYSIDDTLKENSKFVIVNSQPEALKTSQFSIDLTKHKSSSIPQMKLEELKNSLREKTKSKDAIEEVNRMFATVRKCEIKSSEANRPMIRSGPRVLPVVKTDNTDEKPLTNCRYCQTNYRMSSGDSFERHKPNACEECFHMMCCHYHKNSGPTCSNCRNGCEHKE